MELTYTVGSVALGLILFDGGLRTRFQTFRNVIGPAMLSTVGVLATAALTAPAAVLTLGLSWTEALLMGAVVASTDAAAVFFLLHARGLRLRPRVNATLEVRSASTIVRHLYDLGAGGNPALRQQALAGHRHPVGEKAILGGLIGYAGARSVVWVLNKLDLPQGLHAPFVATAALVIFALAQTAHGSGFLAVYIAGLVVGNGHPCPQHGGRLPRRRHLAGADRDVRAARPAGLAASPGGAILPGLAVAAALMLIARPAAVFLCLAPFRFSLREKLFISWVGLRGAVGIFIASIPLLVGLPNAHLYFDVGFIVVLVSLLVQGWTIAPAARRLGVSFPQ